MANTTTSSADVSRATTWWQVELTARHRAPHDVLGAPRVPYDIDGIAGTCLLNSVRSGSVRAGHREGTPASMTRELRPAGKGVQCTTYQYLIRYSVDTTVVLILIL